MGHDLPQPATEAVSLDAALSALAHPTRRRVMLELAGGEDEPRPCSSFGLESMAPSTRTHHWRVLREAGLISLRDVGNGLVVTLRRSEIEQRFPGLLEALGHAEARQPRG